MAAKIRDYVGFGVRSIWVIDPRSREGWNCSDGNWLRQECLTVSDSAMYLSLPELFAKMDAEA